MRTCFLDCSSSQHNCSLPTTNPRSPPSFKKNMEKEKSCSSIHNLKWESFREIYIHTSKEKKLLQTKLGNNHHLLQTIMAFYSSWLLLDIRWRFLFLFSYQGKCKHYNLQEKIGWDESKVNTCCLCHWLQSKKTSRKRKKGTQLEKLVLFYIINDHVLMGALDP